MNPILSPYPNQQPFPFFSAIPNPNQYDISDRSFHNPLPHNPPPSVALPTSGDLSTTISSLKSIIDLSHQTLTSISKFLPVKLHDDGLVQCPFNPNHRMSPESLFNHYLRCSTSLDLSSVVESLRYPKTLKSSEEVAKDDHFVQSLGDPHAELCFTLDGYSDLMSNIFYSDCPGVVTFPCKDDIVKRTFTLPGFLSVECSNLVPDYSGEVEVTDETVVRILPSELWGIESEIGTWNDIPRSCSHDVVCAILGLRKVKDCELGKWVITKSPKFGVVIDVAMRDHVSVLFGICLKAVVREALSLVKPSVLDLKDKSKAKFDCPILVRATIWLASHFSVLYGEMQGKCFALDLLKKGILDTASHLLVYPSEKEVVDSRVGKESTPDLAASHGVNVSLETEEGEFDSFAGQSVYYKKIFVSQVVAAVAALHERSLLEQKIRALRQLQPFPRYQRVIEHTDISTRAAEERKKRPSYRPIIDHDGLPRQPSALQETGKTKTREELLAEERDYKRRRMSYRGKKSKRNPSEVVRNIIEEFMEEIKQAGGIGCFEKGVVDTEIFPPGPPPSFHDQGRNNIANEKGANSSGNQHGTGFDAHSNISFNDEQRRRHPRCHDDRVKGTNGKKLSKDYYHSRSPERMNHRQSDEHDNRRRERHNTEVNRGKSREFERSSSVRSKYHEHISSSSSSRNDLKEGDWKSKSRDRRRRNDYIECSSDYLVENAFEDRYDPSRSDDRYEDEAA